MSGEIFKKAERQDFDKQIDMIAKYAHDFDPEKSKLAMDTAYWCLMDTLACGMLALEHPECCKLMGPVVPGATMANGAKVPGTGWQLDPVQAAFNIGCMIRWLDFNDTWLAAEWGHPSDNMGAILALADYLGRNGIKDLTVKDVVKGMIMAHEIQGVTALENSFNRVGLDHVMLVRLASAAVSARLMGLSFDEIRNVVSHAFIDGSALRTYRHAPNTGSRKSWAAGDATSRGLRLAFIARTGEMGYPTALSAPVWGFNDVLFKGNELVYKQELGSYVMENVLFKISFPAEFHAQTAVECALKLHPLVKDRLDEVERIEIETQEAGARIIDKTGKLDNYADRDHCIQYMVAVPLIFGRLLPTDYSDAVAQDPRIDALRDKMTCKENPEFTKDYFDPQKRYIGNSVQVFFKDGTKTDKVSINAPVGHRERRDEGIPLLKEKVRNALGRRFAKKQAEVIWQTLEDKDKLFAMKACDFTDLWYRT